MKILLIEDEKAIINFLKPNLEDACFVIDVAEDGESGSFMARTNNYDLIILDNVLPKKEGNQVCQEIRDAKKNTPILMLSVVANAEKKIEMLNLGADDYLTKPFSFKELLARIQALLRRPNKVEGKDIKISDLTLNTRSNLVTKNGKTVSLTKKEYMLLEYLMKNQGEVLSRAMILEHVWDINADPFSNTIETHILSLRKKLSLTNQKNKLIRTLSGRGYIMDTNY